MVDIDQFYSNSMALVETYLLLGKLCFLQMDACSGCVLWMRAMYGDVHFDKCYRAMMTFLFYLNIN